MQTEKEYFIKTWSMENELFEKVLKALPDGKLDYRPHPKSRTALEIASVFAMNPMGMTMVLKTGEIGDPEKMNGMPHPKTTDELVKMFRDGVKTAEKELKSISDDDWAKPAVMKMDGKTVWETTRGDMAWGFLTDGIHHRGQLSTYIRPMGGKVPAIYGPSGDDPGEM